MKLLLDENLPIKLTYRFRDNSFETYSVREMEWLGKENGELLSLMIEHDFTTFITIDNNLFFQQNFKHYPIRVLVIISPDNTYETIMQIFSQITEQLNKQFTGVEVVIHPQHSSMTSR